MDQWSSGERLARDEIGHFLQGLGGGDCLSAYEGDPLAASPVRRIAEPREVLSSAGGRSTRAHLGFAANIENRNRIVGNRMVARSDVREITGIAALT